MVMKKLILGIGLISILGLFSLGTALAQVSVGVKPGDWIEYSISYTGSPLDSYPKWIRFDIIDVQGTNITTDLEIERLDGRSDKNSGIFNLETGVPDLLIIPAGLDVGDDFYHEDFGKNNITRIQYFTFAEAKRTLVSAHIENIALLWDKSTGVLVQSIQYENNFNQTLSAEKTNMWQAQIFGLDPLIFYVLVLAVVVLIIVITLFLYRKRLG